ncbi:MAG: hypothetical protein L6Q57_00280 [Alphaproteobacteria bacterium]|nr:hypothetical protein [Alphaproteobacteria bacterium]
MSKETPTAPVEDKSLVDKSPVPMPKKAARGDRVVFDDDVEICYTERLPEYDIGDVKAYAAEARAGAEGVFFALVCERRLVPRDIAANVYSSVLNPSLIPLHGKNVIFWPPENGQRFVLVYKGSLGNPILKRGDKEALGWRQEKVMQSVLRPLVGVLQDFRDRDFVHGCINPFNIFDGNQKGNLERVLLGDCLSVPPSFAQPALYETIERSMAHPLARGKGTHVDDLYSFGVTLAVLLRNADPLHGMSEEDVIREKIEHGSYAAITGKDRFKGSMLELLRGLLHDDAGQRWTVDEVLAWMDGRRLSPKQPIKAKKAARPLAFDGKKYITTSPLAMDLEKNPQELVRIVDSGELEQWISRSLDDELVTVRVEQAIRAAREKGIGPGYENRLLSMLSSAIDPGAPIRFHGLRMMGDGVGAFLADHFAMRHDLQPFTEFFTLGIGLNWITNQTNPTIDVGTLISRFDFCRSYVRQNKIGYGLERCLYLLCPESPCMSEKIKDYVVLSPEHLINAFEDLCQKNKAPTLYLDRHSAAFLAAKDSKLIDPYLYDLAQPDRYRQVLGNLKCLAAMQKKLSLGAFPGIAQNLSRELSVVYARIHNQDTRQQLEVAVNRAASEGDIKRMAVILDNPDIYAKDFYGFRDAMKEYADLRKEYHNLKRSLEDQASFGKTTGHDIAALVSSILAGLIILFLAFMFFTNKSIM